jgi:hypothetical protein
MDAGGLMATTSKHRWSQAVTETSDAMTLDQGVFISGSAHQVAMSLKRLGRAQSSSQGNAVPIGNVDAHFFY